MNEPNPVEADAIAKLRGKVALITGASRGIGLAIARALAANGAAIAITARTAATLEEARADLARGGADTLSHAADVSAEGDVERLFAAVLERFGRLDLLVNNAGAFDGGPLDELSLQAWDRVIATNLRAPFLCTRAAIRIMKPQGGGRIINIGSISAQRVRPNSAPYSTSKHGLWGLTQVTALEGREFGITCGCLHPGNTLVERRQESGLVEDDEPMIATESIAEVALLMATLPKDVAMLEAIVLPHQQEYVGRG
jgi:NAD(P)-dependent dehydrogenase (short-subunit alcohol dehydrogenase family)